MFLLSQLRHITFQNGPFIHKWNKQGHTGEILETRKQVCKCRFLKLPFLAHFQAPRLFYVPSPILGNGVHHHLDSKAASPLSAILSPYSRIHQMAHRSNSVGSVCCLGPLISQSQGSSLPPCCYLSRIMWSQGSSISKEHSLFPIYGRSVETKAMNDLNIPMPHSLYSGYLLEPKRSPTVLC